MSYENQRHIIDAHKNPLAPSNQHSEELTQAQTYQLESTAPEYEETKVLVKAVSERFTRRILRDLATYFPKSLKKYKPPQTPNLILSSANQKGSSTELTFRPQYSPKYHRIAINMDADPLIQKINIIHETLHSLANNIISYKITLDPYEEIDHAHDPSILQGFKVASTLSGKVTGEALNEGATNYFTKEFILKDQSKESEDIRDIVLNLLRQDKIKIEKIKEKQLSQIKLFLELQDPEEYLLICDLIEEIVTNHPEMESLFLCSLVSPVAKARLARNLRKLYGFEVTRDLFAATVNNFISEVDSSKLDELYRLREIIKIKNKQAKEQERREKFLQNVNRVMSRVRSMFAKT